MASDFVESCKQLALTNLSHLVFIFLNFQPVKKLLVDQLTLTSNLNKNFQRDHRVANPILTIHP